MSNTIFLAKFNMSIKNAKVYVDFKSFEKVRKIVQEKSSEQKSDGGNFCNGLVISAFFNTVLVCKIIFFVLFNLFANFKPKARKTA